MVNSLPVLATQPNHRRIRRRHTVQLAQRKLETGAARRIRYTRNRPSINLNLQPQRPDKHLASRHIPRLHHHRPITRRARLPTICHQTQLRVLHDVRAGAEDQADVVGAVVAAVRVPGQRVGEGVERGGGEAVVVDVGERTVHAAVADAQEIGVVRGAAEGGQRDEGVETGAVVMDLALDAAEFTAVTGEALEKIRRQERKEKKKERKQADVMYEKKGWVDAYMLSQYRLALPFHPQCATVGWNPNTVPKVLALVAVNPKYLLQ